MLCCKANPWHLKTKWRSICLYWHCILQVANLFTCKDFGAAGTIKQTVSLPIFPSWAGFSGHTSSAPPWYSRRFEAKTESQVRKSWLGFGDSWERQPHSHVRQATTKQIPVPQGSGFKLVRSMAEFDCNPQERWNHIPPFTTLVAHFFKQPSAPCLHSCSELDQAQADKSQGWMAEPRILMLAIILFSKLSFNFQVIGPKIIGQVSVMESRLKSLLGSFHFYRKQNFNASEIQFLEGE